MSDWVFCNKCSQKHQPNTKFLLSECGHIFCEKCVLGFQPGTCNFCNKPAKMLEVCKNMNIDAQQYFWPIEGFLQKFMQVFQFQNKHKLMFQQALMKKYSYAKKECIHYYNAQKKLRQENEILKSMLKNTGMNPNQLLITSTPKSNSSKSFDNDLSLLSSVKFTPGCAHRIHNYSAQHQQHYQQNAHLQGNSIESLDGPSPVQTVPKGYHQPYQQQYSVPIHRGQATGHLAAAPPAFMEKIRRDAMMAQSGNPRKQI